MNALWTLSPGTVFSLCFGCLGAHIPPHPLDSVCCVCKGPGGMGSVRSYLPSLSLTSSLYYSSICYKLFYATFTVLLGVGVGIANKHAYGYKKVSCQRGGVSAFRLPQGLGDPSGACLTTEERHELVLLCFRFIASFP